MSKGLSREFFEQIASPEALREWDVSHCEQCEGKGWVKQFERIWPCAACNFDGQHNPPKAR